jgi:hypothetical protein
MPEIQNSLFPDLTSCTTTHTAETRVTDVYHVTALAASRRRETITIGDGAVIGANDHAF